MTFEEWLSDKYLGSMELEFSKDAFKAGAASRDAEIAELVAVLENCRLFASRHRKEDWASHILRFCESVGVAGSPLRDKVRKP